MVNTLLEGHSNTTPKTRITHHEKRPRASEPEISVPPLARHGEPNLPEDASSFCNYNQRSVQRETSTHTKVCDDSDITPCKAVREQCTDRSVIVLSAKLVDTFKKIRTQRRSSLETISALRCEERGSRPREFARQTLPAQERTELA